MSTTRKTTVIVLVALLAACAGGPRKVDEAPISTTLEGAGMTFGRDQVTPLEEPAPLPAGELSTADAVAWSLANHPQVHVVLAGLDAQAAQRWQAGLLPNPMLSIMGMRRDGGGWMLEYGLMQSLIAVLERPRRVADADAALDQATAEAAVALLDLARGVEAAHLAAVAAMERERILAHRVELIDKQLDLLRREQARGRSTMLSLLELEQDAADAVARVASASSEAAARRAALARAMGLERAAGLELPPSLPPAPVPDVDEAVLLEIARRQRPDVDVATAARERAAAGLELERFGRGVDVLDVGVRREPDSSGPELRVSIPVFDNAAPRVARARADIDAAEAREVLLQRQVGVEVEEAVLVLARRHAAHEVVEQAAVLAAERAELSGRLQAGGAADLGQSLRAQDAALQAGVARIDARLAVWDAWLALATATASALVSPQVDD